MKNILGIALFCICQFVKGQSYIAFPDSGAIWINTKFSFNTLPAQYYSYIYTTNGLDTLINNTNYFVVQTNVNGPYYGAMRNDAGKVYIVPKDSLQEYIVYDFTANIGDTIDQVYEDGGLFTFFGGVENIVVVDTATIDLGDGIIRRKIFTSNNRTWIEGIGSTSGLFSEDSENVSSYGGYLYCFSVSNTTLYPSYATVACDINVGLSSIGESKILQVYPNPTNAIFTIEAESNINNILVYDALGQMINIPKEINQNKVIFFTDKLENGLYFIRFEINNEKHFQKLMKQD